MLRIDFSRIILCTFLTFYCESPCTCFLVKDRLTTFAMSLLNVQETLRSGRTYWGSTFGTDFWLLWAIRIVGLLHLAYRCTIRANNLDQVWFFCKVVSRETMIVTHVPRFVRKTTLRKQSVAICNRRVAYSFCALGPHSR